MEKLSIGKEKNENLKIGIHTVENAIREALPIDELVEIFGTETYLVGGLVRDLILGKSIAGADIDLMTRTPLEDVLRKLDELGYSESTDTKFIEKGYSLKRSAGIINVLLSGREIQVGVKGDTSIEELISTGDLNLNCCAFDLGSRTIINPEVFEEISNKTLLFCNPELAKDDPMKIVSALKLMSKIPDLQIPEETFKTITESLPLVIDFFAKNPDRRYKLNPLFGNINSGEIIKMFEEYDTQGIFDGIDLKRQKLEVSTDYTSCQVEELDGATKTKIINLIKEKFGNEFDETKLFNKKVNSVVYKLNANEGVDACCLIDSERIYLATAVDATQIINIVSNLCNHNYNIWTTISFPHHLLMTLAQKAGLHVVNDPDLIKKILISNYPEYADRLIVEVKRGYSVFTKLDSSDEPQMLLTS